MHQAAGDSNQLILVPSDTPQLTYLLDTINPNMQQANFDPINCDALNLDP
jgi:hypothetical protein